MEWETKLNEYGMYSQYPKKKYTVKEWLQEILMDSEINYIENITINGKYYNIMNLEMGMLDGINLDAEVERTDNGYYGTKGIKTK